MQTALVLVAEQFTSQIEMIRASYAQFLIGTYNPSILPPNGILVDADQAMTVCMSFETDGYAPTLMNPSAWRAFHAQQIG